MTRQARVPDQHVPSSFPRPRRWVTDAVCEAGTDHLPPHKAAVLQEALVQPEPQATYRECKLAIPSLHPLLCDSNLGRALDLLGTATSLPLDCSSVACSGVRITMQAMLCSCLSMLSALHHGMKWCGCHAEQGSLQPGKQRAASIWGLAEGILEDEIHQSGVHSKLCPTCNVSYVIHLSMSHGWVLQGLPPGSAAMNRAGQEEIMLMQSTAAPDLPILEAVLELSGSHHDTGAAIPEQTPAEEQIDAAMAGGTKQHPDPALPLKSLQPQSAETLQAADNLSAEATVKSPPGPLQKEAKLSQLRLEALVNYTHEELQALSNPGGLMGSVLHEAEQKAAAVHPTNVPQAPLLTVVASQLETVSAAEAAANPDTGVDEQQQQQQQPVTFASLAQKQEEALLEREDGDSGNSSSHASHGQDTAVAVDLQQQLDRQKQHGGLASSISESPGSAAARGIPHGLQTGSDRHKAMSSTVSETHPVLQRLMDQAEAQHGANGSQIVHHLMQALHLSGHLHSDQHLPAEHSSLLGTLSHMLHRPTQVGIEACLDSP